MSIKAIGEPDIQIIFSSYGFTASEGDINWWQENSYNQWGTLEQNLQRRFSQNKFLEPTANLGQLQQASDGIFGNAAAFRPSEYKTTLAQSFTEAHSNTTLKVSSITTKDGNTLDPTVLGSVIVLSINPGGSNSEIVQCSGLTTSTKTFTGCTFGMRFDRSGSQASNVKTHAPGEVVIISNTDTFLTQVVAYVNASTTVTGQWGFTTTTVASTKVYLGPDGAYLWYNTGSHSVGFASSTLSGEFAFNNNGTSFTPVRPILLTGGELKLATSTYDFRLRDNLLAVATSTITNGTASGNVLDDLFNSRYNATSTFAQDIKIGGNATATKSMDAAGYCVNGKNCRTSFVSVATSTNTELVATGIVTNFSIFNYTLPASSLYDGDEINFQMMGNYHRVTGNPSFTMTVNGQNVAGGNPDTNDQSFKLDLNIGLTTGKLNINQMFYKALTIDNNSSTASSTSNWNLDGLNITILTSIANANDALRVQIMKLVKYSRN
jgi:hypothetical protein